MQLGRFENHQTITESIELPMVYDINHNVVKSILSQAAGVLRKSNEMKKAFNALEEIRASATITKFNLTAFQHTVALDLSILLLHDALSKKKSIGVHYVEQ
jgi:aspartate oxidase